MDREKLIHQLFVGKVAEIIGQEKTLELLREAKQAIETSNSCKNCEHYKPVYNSLYFYNTGNSKACYLNPKKYMDKDEDDLCNNHSLKTKI